MNSVNAKTLILLSSFVYAFLPLIAYWGGAEIGRTLFFVFPVFQFVIFLPFLLSKKVHAGLLLAWQDSRLFLFLVANALLFMTALYAMIMALDTGHPVLVIALTELWPLAMTAIVAGMIGKNLKSLKGTGYIQAALALGGIFLIAKAWQTPNALDSQVVMWALLCAVAMGAAASFKAKAVNILEKKVGTIPQESVAVLMLWFMPVWVGFVIFGFFAQNAPLSLPRWQEVEADLPFIAMLVFFNAVSALLYAFATLRMKEASDSLLWFLTPVIATAIIVGFGNIPVTVTELVGIALVAAAGLVPWATATRLEKIEGFTDARINVQGESELQKTNPQNQAPS